MVKGALSLALTFVCLFLLGSCNSYQSSTTLHNEFGENEVKHAVGFTLQRKGEVVRIAVKADSLHTLATYYLVRDSSIEVPTDGEKVLIPLKQIVTTSTTHYEPIVLLNELPSLTGICNPERTYNTAVRTAFSNKQIKNLGDSYSINREQLLELGPDAVLTSRYAAADPMIDALKQSGYLLLYNQEWQEHTLLGRTEWLKFIAAFYDKLSLADSLFASTEQRYNQLKAKTATITPKPKIMSGCCFHGTWYVPGGKSYMAELYESAGAEYIYAADKNTGSLPLNLETVITDFSDADYWFGVQANTLAEVLSAEPRIKDMKSVKKRLVYNFNRRSADNGSTDFWEGAVYHPDWLLADVIAALHPSVLPSHQYVYLQQVK